MTLLFDISPDEPTRAAKRGRREATVAAQEAAVEPFKPTPLRPLLPIGRIDHTYKCADSKCQAECHDILHEDRREWLISCCFCGTAQWVRAVALPTKAVEEEFVLRDGRFAGMTLREVESETRGPEYLKWAAESHPRASVRDAVKKHLDTMATNR